MWARVTQDCKCAWSGQCYVSEHLSLLFVAVYVCVCVSYSYLPCVLDLAIARVSVIACGNAVV